MSSQTKKSGSCKIPVADLRNIHRSLPDDYILWIRTHQASTVRCSVFTMPLISAVDFVLR
jgi:hypothetical protein